MNQNPSEGPHEPQDLWRNLFARAELEQQLKRTRPVITSLAEAFAAADVRPHEPPDVAKVVEDIHVKKAADVLFALAQHPDIYRKVGSPELFVSFAGQQRDLVKPFVEALERASFRCFFSDKSIEFSMDWAKEISGNLRVCRVLLPVVTSDWIDSPWCNYELGGANSLNKHVVPVIVGSVAVPKPVGDHQGFSVKNADDLINLPERDPDLWHRLVKELRRLCYRDIN